MAKDPAFLFYTDNFQSGTQFFTDEQVGKYIRLLCAQHLHGHLSEKQVLLICKTWDEEIMQKFVFEGGKYYNKRLEIEVQKRKLFSESRSNNRLGKTKKHKKNTRKTSDIHLGNGNGDGNTMNNSMPPSQKMVEEIFISQGFTEKEGQEFFDWVVGKTGWQNINDWRKYTLSVIARKIANQPKPTW